MLKSPSSSRRIAGRVVVVSAIAVALPLTASRAVNYVDVPAPAAPVLAPASVLPASTAVTTAAVQPASWPAPAVHRIAAAAPRAAHTSDLDRDVTLGDFIMIDGKEKRWDELTPAEKKKVARAVARARTALANARIDQARLMRDLANLPDQARIAQMQRELAGTRERIADSVRRMDSEAAAARRSGRQSDRLEEAVRERLQSLQNVDFAAASRAIANIDRAKIAAEVAGTQESVEKAKAELARMQARIDADRQK